MVTEAWLPMRFSEAVTAAALKKKALFEILLGAGVTFGRANQELSAEAADPATARLLDTAIGAPILRITRVLHDAAGAPVQHLTARLTPERSRVVMDIPASDVDTLSAGYVAHDVSPSLRARRRPNGLR
jgi:GntR family transcriptional regulator